ncbi:MAG: hypothetical protein QE280_14470 [Caulobacter sp.]|nr:hypothetical protein [Caulobacter sp.]
MKNAVPLLCTLMLLGACATTPAANPGRIQTTDQANRENLVGAASSPLRDMNVVRTKIPPVLLDALADPYARPPSRSCEDLVGLIVPLTLALGPDLDAILAEVRQTGEQMVGDQVMGMAVGAAQDLIPLRSWVRRLTGAERHDRLVRSAISAGVVRRAYLKGLGQAGGCLAPAAPLGPARDAQSPAA